jgi:hypothetical protein
MTQEQCNALATRMAAVLRERKNLGEVRRKQEREYQRRESGRPLVRSYQLRGESRKYTDLRFKEIYETIMSSNAAVLGIKINTQETGISPQSTVRTKVLSKSITECSLPDL